MSAALSGPVLIFAADGLLRATGYLLVSLTLLLVMLIERKKGRNWRPWQSG
jgi:hypothetical protein